MKRTQLKRTKPLTSVTQLHSTGLTRRAWVRNRPAAPAGKPPAYVELARPRPRPTAEFSAAVKLAVRKRAGDGDPEQACCENCGKWLGLEGGQVQHRVARMMGGRGPKAPWWISAIVNAGLLCGTPLWGCHKRAEDRDEDMGPDAAGWWLEHGQNPALVPVIVHGIGTPVYLNAAGQYSAQPPSDGAS